MADFDVVISAGQASGTATFTLTPTQDTEIEGSETIGVDGSAAGLTVNGAVLTLTDDDGAPSVNLSLNPATAGEDDEATQVAVTAAFSNNSTYAIDKTVTVTVGGSGTATSGADYAAVSDFDITIAKGATSGTGTFTLTPAQDTEVEGSETIGVDGSAAGLTVNGAVLTLTDDDGAPSVNLSLNPATAGEDDEATQVTVTAAFSNSSTYAIDKTVTVTVGGSGTATSGADYAAVSDFDVTIAKGATSGTGTFTLTPAQDTEVEGSETIGVDGGAAGLTVNGAALTLTEVGNTPPVAVDDLVTVQRGGSASQVSNSATSVALHSETTSPGAMERDDDGTDDPFRDGNGSDDDKPASEAREASTAEALNSLATGVLHNDHDEEDHMGRCRAELVSGAQYGDLTLNGDGTFLYIHDGSSTSADSFTYRVVDSHGHFSNVATVNIQVLATEEEPAAGIDLHLAALARTVASQAVDAIGGRLENGPRGSGASLGGQQFDLGSGEAGDVQAAGWVQGLARMLGRGQRFVAPARMGDARTAAGLPAPGQMQANTWWAGQSGLTLDGQEPFGSGAAGVGGGSPHPSALEWGPGQARALFQAGT